MKYNKSLLVITIIILISSSLMFSQRMMRNENFPERIKEKLNLTPEQEKKISELRITQQEKMIDLTSAIKKKELEKDKLLMSDNISRNDLINITKEISDVRNQIDLLKINHQMDIYDLLDKIQKSTWKSMMIKGDQLRGEMKERMQRRMRDQNDMRPKRNPPLPPEEPGDLDQSEGPEQSK